MLTRSTKHNNSIKLSKLRMKKSKAKTNNLHNEVVLDVIELDPLVEERWDLQSPSFGSLERRDLQSPSFGSLEGRDLKGTVGSLNLNECIICLEILDNEQNKAVVSKNSLFESISGNEYYLGCICNIHIHKTCMMNWMKQSITCPICLTALHKFERWVIIRNLGVIIITTGSVMCILLTFMNMINPFIQYYQNKHF